MRINVIILLMMGIILSISSLAIHDEPWRNYISGIGTGLMLPAWFELFLDIVNAVKKAVKLLKLWRS